ncbi:MAG: response regulator transcription factor [Bacillota bacterium]
MTDTVHRVLVADDHSVVRRGIVALLSQRHDIVVVGEAADGLEAVRLASDLKPDVAILDVRMPGLGGVEACTRILQASPNTRVVFFTSFPDEEALVGAMLAGARGFVLKNLPDDSLVEAIRAVARGESVLDPSLGAAVAAGMKRLAAGTPVVGGPDGIRHKASGTPALPLTEVDLALLRFIAEGRTNREIAEVMNFTEKTIRNYVSALLAKLGLRNRAEAAAYAVAHGLVKG